jgi:hypothetical protein
MSRLKPILIKVLAILLVLKFISGCTTIESDFDPGNPYAYDRRNGLDEKDILAHFNLHRGRWWNYYARGSWLLECGHYSLARRDFVAAIKKRSRDSWDARMYGMHFIDYFPHRESGIAFYHEAERERNPTDKIKLFRKAICQFKISIDQEKSSKADFYLNRANAGFWKESRLDVTPPVVGIANGSIDRWAIPPVLYTNTYTTKLEIRAWDHQSGVAEVWIDDSKIFIESVDGEFYKDVVVRVHPPNKEKTVVITSADLAGNSNKEYPMILRLVVDTNPPVASIRVHAEDKLNPFRGIPVQIAAVDDQGLRSVQIGEHPSEACDCGGKTTWNDTYYAKSSLRDLMIKITDRAGNVTTTTVALESGQMTTRIMSRPVFRDWTFPTYDRAILASRMEVIPRKSVPWLEQPVRALTLQMYNFSPKPRRANLLRSASQNIGAILVFPNLKGITEVQTSHDMYLLHGEISHIEDLCIESITIGSNKINVISNKDLPPLEQPFGRGTIVRKTSDLVAFSALVPVHYDKSQCVDVKASFTGGIETSFTKPNLCITGVQNQVWATKSIYSVDLGDLQKIPVPRKSQDQPLKSKVKSCSDMVLRAIVACGQNDPNDGKFHKRFNCKALACSQNIEHTGIEDALEISNTTSSGQVPSQIESQEADTDLIIDGWISEWHDKFEIKLKVLNLRNHGKPLFKKPIDIFGTYADPNFCINGLRAKFEEKFPRIEAKVRGHRSNRIVTIDRGRIDNIFENMDFVAYKVVRPGGELNYIPLCNMRVENVYGNEADIRFIDSSSDRFWDPITKKQIEVCLISK